MIFIHHAAKKAFRSSYFLHMSYLYIATEIMAEFFQKPMKDANPNPQPPESHVACAVSMNVHYTVHYV